MGNRNDEEECPCKSASLSVAEKLVDNENIRMFTAMMYVEGTDGDVDTPSWSRNSFAEFFIDETEKPVHLQGQQLSNVEILFGNHDANEAYRQFTMSKKPPILGC